MFVFREGERGREGGREAERRWREGFSGGRGECVTLGFGVGFDGRRKKGGGINGLGLGLGFLKDRRGDEP